MISILIPIISNVNTNNVLTMLKSIISQTYVDWTILIGINEDVEIDFDTIKHEHDGISVLYTQSLSKYDMLHYLTDMSTSEWITVAEPGDVWYENKLEKQMIYSDRYDVIGSACRFNGLHKNILGVSCCKIRDEHFFHGNPFVINSALIRRTLCKWEPKYDIHSDYRLLSKLHLSGVQMFNVNEILLYCKMFDTCNKSEVSMKNDILNKLIRKFKKKVK